MALFETRFNPSNPLSEAISQALNRLPSMMIQQRHERKMMDVRNSFNRVNRFIDRKDSEILKLSEEIDEISNNIKTGLNTVSALSGQLASLDEWSGDVTAAAQEIPKWLSENTDEYGINAKDELTTLLLDLSAKESENAHYKSQANELQRVLNIMETFEHEAGKVGPGLGGADELTNDTDFEVYWDKSLSKKSNIASLEEDWGSYLKGAFMMHSPTMNEQRQELVANLELGNAMKSFNMRVGQYIDPMFQDLKGQLMLNTGLAVTGTSENDLTAEENILHFQSGDRFASADNLVAGMYPAWSKEDRSNYIMSTLKEYAGFGDATSFLAVLGENNNHFNVIGTLYPSMILSMQNSAENYFNIPQSSDLSGVDTLIELFKAKENKKEPNTDPYLNYDYDFSN